jgi:hypothetical protein
MPLRDHFRPPLSIRRHWHGFHSSWCTYLASHLNELLPEGYFAEPNVQFGIEIDVASWEEAGLSGAAPASTWSAPAPTQTIPISIITDVVEVQVFDREGGPTLAGAIELVSPANKDRSEHRDAFVSKCAAYIQQGVGLIVIDVVTARRARLHEDLLARVHGVAEVPLDADLYATAYRPLKRDDQVNLNVWQHSLAVGQPLPVLPLGLKGGLSLRVDLETTYERTCREQRITDEIG